MEEKNQCLMWAVVMFAVGLIVFGILSNNLGNNNITLKEIERIKVGMTYEGVVDVIGSESEREETQISGEEAMLYTWFFYSGGEKYSFSTLCADEKVIKITEEVDTN